MAQKIVTMCDAHLYSEDAEVPGVAWEVTLLGPGQTKPTTWVVDLCADDGKTLEDLSVMLGTVGRVTDGPRRPRKPTADRTAPGAPAAAHTAPRELLAGRLACPWTVVA